MSWEMLRMGNYGAYVWSSYVLTVIALVAMAFAARRAAKNELKAALRRVQINATNPTQAGEQQSKVTEGST